MIAYSFHTFAANRLSAGSEAIEDLRRLSVVFGHVEKLLTIAASLHWKFLQAPSMSEAIFASYYEFYSKRMGTGSGEENGDMVTCY